MIDLKRIFHGTDELNSPSPEYTIHLSASWSIFLSVVRTVSREIRSIDF